MNIFNITYKDIQILLRDRATLMQVFLLPFVFIFVFGAIGSAADSGEEVVELPVVNLDGGAESHSLIGRINNAGGVKCVAMEKGDAESALEAGEINWMLTIPAGFSADLAANEPTTLRYVSHPDADSTRKAAVRLVIDGAAQDMALKTQVLASLAHMGQMQASASEQSVFTTERILSQAENQFDRAEEQSLVTIQQLRPGQLGERKDPEPMSGTQVYVPAFTVLFVFLATGVTAASIFNEKKIGSFRRLLAAPIPKAELLLGKMLPALLIALIQVIVIFAIGVWLLPVIGMDGLKLGDEPLAVAVIIVSIALCATGLGVLISAIAKTEGQISGGSAVLLWVMGALGGAFFPTYLLEGFVGQLGKVVPHYWANRAFYGVLVRGQGLADIGTEVAVLLAFTALFWLIGVWRFDFD